MVTVGMEIAVTAETMTEAELVTTVETVEAGPVVVRVRVVTAGIRDTYGGGWSRSMS